MAVSLRTWERSGIRLQYPAKWGVDVDSDEESEAWTATFESPETAFLTLSFQPEATSAQDIVDQALTALREVYPNLEAEASVESVAAQPALGYDLDFLSLDASVSCWLRAFETVSGPALVMMQVAEFDFVENEPHLHNMLDSIELYDE
jgi:hypothetical protein